ncbi:MAG: hypothetical protein ABI609_14145 [Acidobacteriota bacterium]
MTARGFAEVCLKLIGGYWVVVALLSVPSLLTGYSMAASSPQMETKTWLAASLLGIALHLAIGVTVLSYAERLAGRVAPGEAVDSGSPSRPQTMQGAAFSVLGAYFVVLALSSAAQHIYSFAVLKDHADSWQYKEVWNREWSGIVATVTELVAGLMLFLGGKSLARLWHQLRSPAVLEPETSAAESQSPDPEESRESME